MLCVTWALFNNAVARSNFYPSKPVRYIIPFPPGGITDALARVIGEHMYNVWGQPVVNEYRPGASGTIGTEIAARSTSDGYTLLGGAINTHAINASLYKLPYDPLKDFVPVTMIATTTNIMVTSPNHQAKNLNDFIWLAKNQTIPMKFASGGSGTSGHLASELLNIMIGTKMVHIPYKGSQLAIGEVINGQIDFMIDLSSMPLIKSGKLRAIGVTSLHRLSTLPDVPAISESIPGFQISSWQGLFVPSNTPRDIVTKLNMEVRRGLNTPQSKLRIEELGAEVSTNTSESFAEYIRTEITKWNTVIKTAGIKLQM